MAVNAVLLVDALARVKIGFLLEPLTGCIAQPHREARRNENHDEAGAKNHR